jgi:hypothetical protein
MSNRTSSSDFARLPSPRVSRSRRSQRSRNAFLHRFERTGAAARALPDGTKLFAVNTPDNQLEIFSVSPAGLVHTGSGQVAWSRSRSRRARTPGLGRQPSPTAATSTSQPRRRSVENAGRRREPRDILFGGTGGGRAFITTAHRGQQRSDRASAPAVAGSGSPRLTTGHRRRRLGLRRDEPRHHARRHAAPHLTFFGDTPRALAKAPTATRLRGRLPLGQPDRSGARAVDLRRLRRGAAVLSIGWAAAPSIYHGPDDNAAEIPLPKSASS